MPSPFPGMDPYLERPSLSAGLHAGLAVYAADVPGQQLGDRYWVNIGERRYSVGFPWGVMPDYVLVRRPAPTDPAQETARWIRQMLDARAGGSPGTSSP